MNLNYSRSCKLVIIFLFFVTVFPFTGFTMERPADCPSPNETDADGVKIISVDAVAGAPENYTEYIGVKGDVLKVYEDKKMFYLSCGDSCVRLPIQYGGEMPGEKARIIVYGEIVKSDDGRYVFNAKKIESK